MAWRILMTLPEETDFSSTLKRIHGADVAASIPDRGSERERMRDSAPIREWENAPMMEHCDFPLKSRRWRRGTCSSHRSKTLLRHRGIKVSNTRAWAAPRKGSIRVSRNDLEIDFSPRLDRQSE